MCVSSPLCPLSSLWFCVCFLCPLATRRAMHESPNCGSAAKRTKNSKYLSISSSPPCGSDWREFVSVSIVQQRNLSFAVHFIICHPHLQIVDFLPKSPLRRGFPCGSVQSVVNFWCGRFGRSYTEIHV